uniref:Uncharacterized protein n=1 Tax=Globodera rostochiensis TaxID=31243 RepID=A0A914HZ72_GLORO
MFLNLLANTDRCQCFNYRSSNKLAWCPFVDANDDYFRELEHRIKACEFILEKSADPYMPGQQASSSTSNQWLPAYGQAIPAGPINPTQVPLSADSRGPAPAIYGPNLAVLYGGEMLRNLRQILMSANGIINVDDDEVKKQNSRSGKVWKGVKNSFHKKFDKNDYATKRLNRQDRCLQKLALNGYFKNNELIITLRINKETFDEFKNIIENGGGFIDRIIYYPEHEWEKKDDKFFEQLFVNIMNLKYTVYLYENQMGMGNNAMMGMNNNPMMGMNNNNGMMDMNNNPIMGMNNYNYGMAVGNMVGNVVGNLINAMNSGMGTGNNKDHHIGIANMMNASGMEATTFLTHTLTSTIIEDIGMAIKGTDQWSNELLVKLLDEELFVGMKYRKGNAVNMPHWDAVLSLSPKTKAMLQFCKCPPAMNFGLKFRMWINKMPENLIWRQISKLWDGLNAKQICF